MDDFEQNTLEKRTNGSYNTFYQNPIGRLSLIKANRNITLRTKHYNKKTLIK